MAPKTLRPGRTLLIFGLTIAILYGLAALGGTWKPRLGLDLEGGTRITLVAKNKPTPEKLRQAASIIEQRVNGTGVSEAEVSTQGNTNIVVEIPGKNRQDLVASVQRTAQMRFRLEANCAQLTGGPCYASGRPASKSTASPSASPTASPTAKSTGKPSTKSTAKIAPTASPKPRPAPAFGVKAATPKPSPKATKTTKTTKATPKAPTVPAAQAKGAPVDQPLEWTQNPGSEWQLRFAAARCDANGVAMVPVSSKDLKTLKPAVDNPDQPIIACDDQGNKSLLSSTVIKGTELKTASYGQQQGQTNWVVNLTFKGAAVKTFADLSRKMVDSSGTPYAGGRFGVVLDGKAIQIAGFSGVIPNGQAVIEGTFTEASARSLANSLKFGALPVTFEKDTSVQTIGASLAGNQLSAGIWAGVVGLVIVMLYCLLYYRGLGLVVIASLIVAAAVTYAVVLILAQTAGFALTLPGIAGLIVAVGITADSFIVLFERIRDEMREGRSMRVAVEAGWKRARNTCLAADAVSFLAAVVLYIFAIGVVRGFAFALGISTLIDVAVFFWFTKPMMTFLARYPFFNRGHKLSGLSDDTLGVHGAPAGGKF